MTLTLGHALEHVRHTLGKGIALPGGGSFIVQQAGTWLTTAHPWRFQERPEAHLNLRGSISFTGASWTEGSRTLTKTGAFAGYVFLEGDEVEITAGTNATTGFYIVESRTSDDAIVLKTSPGATASALTGNLSLHGVALPADFREIIALLPDEGLFGDIERISHQELLRLRTRRPEGTSPYYFYAITYAPVARSGGGAPVPRLELDRKPVTSTTAAFLLIYRKKFELPSDDNHLIGIPEHVEGVFLRAVRAFARGYEEEDAGAMAGRLEEIQASVEWAAAIRADGATDGTVGQMRGGAAEQYHGGPLKWHRTDVIVNVP